MLEGWETMSAYGMLFGPFIMILVLASVVLLVVLLIRWLDGGFIARERYYDRSPQSSSKALHILEERFARGEIDEKEFEEKSRFLSD